MSKEQGWYVIYTAPRSEKKVSERLRSQGITHYLPLQKTLKSWSDRKKWVEEPVFRSYVFVFISLAEYYSVLNISGVVRFVSFGGAAVTVPAYQMDMIRQILLDASCFDLVQEPLARGMPVEITAGPLLGAYGQLVQFRGEKRVAVRVHYTGSTLLVNVEEKFIEPLKDPLKIELFESEAKVIFGE
jgi:transcriptional antiterminator RfaH